MASEQLANANQISKSNYTLLIDGDILCYKAAVVNQAIYELEDTINIIAKIDTTIKFVNDYLIKLMKKFKLKDNRKVYIAFTGSGNWRHCFYPQYKSNRFMGLKPVLIPHLRQYLSEHYYTYEVPLLEGDDLLGIMATSDRWKGNKVIVSCDKDLTQIPGLVYNDVTKVLYNISESEALYNTAYRILVGDTADGYPGLPRIGTKKAKDFLEQLCKPDSTEISEGVNIYQQLRDFYIERGQTEEYFESQVAVATMLTINNYDLDSSTVNMFGRSIKVK